MWQFSEEWLTLVAPNSKTLAFCSFQERVLHLLQYGCFSACWIPCSAACVWPTAAHIFKALFLFIWMFLLFSPHYLLGVNILRGICSFLQFCFSLRKSNVLEISPVGNLPNGRERAAEAKEKISSPDTWASNDRRHEGLSPGRLCVSYSTS